MKDTIGKQTRPGAYQGGRRADARRNVESLLETAKHVFATSGVDAPVREIAKKAGVGIGTLYRHFPKRSDLILAIFFHEVDACAEASKELAAVYEPWEALQRWTDCYIDLIATKRGLGEALHDADSTYDELYIYFEKHLQPALQTLLNAASCVGEIRQDVEARDLLLGIARLCTPAHEHERSYNWKQMIELLLCGLRTSSAAHC